MERSEILLAKKAKEYQNRLTEIERTNISFKTCKALAKSSNIPFFSKSDLNTAKRETAISLFSENIPVVVEQTNASDLIAGIMVFALSEGTDYIAFENTIRKIGFPNVLTVEKAHTNQTYTIVDIADRDLEQFESIAFGLDLSGRF